MDKNGWIKCLERLPERGVNVLVLEKGGFQSVKYIPICSKSGNYAGDDGKTWYPGGIEVGWTTHWQPLPPPQKELEDG